MTTNRNKPIAQDEAEPGYSDRQLAQIRRDIAKGSRHFWEVRGVEPRKWMMPFGGKKKAPNTGA